MTDRKLDYIKKLAEEWARCGVASGDVLLVHSNIKRTMITARRAGVTLTLQAIF